MPNLSNHANIFLKFYPCYDIADKNRLILYIFGTNQPEYGLHSCKIQLGSVPKCSIYVHYIIINVVCTDISAMNQWILYMLGTVINHYRGVMY